LALNKENQSNSSAKADNVRHPDNITGDKNIIKKVLIKINNSSLGTASHSATLTEQHLAVSGNNSEREQWEQKRLFNYINLKMEEQ
jgi:hypothetical protein